MGKGTIPENQNRNLSRTQGTDTQPMKSRRVKSSGSAANSTNRDAEKQAEVKSSKPAVRATNEKAARKTSKPTTESAAKTAGPTARQTRPTTRTAARATTEKTKPTTESAAKTATNKTGRRAGTEKTQINSYDLDSESIDHPQDRAFDRSFGSIPDMQGAGADAIREYLRDIGKVKLLDSELEVALARQIEAGRKAAEKLGIPLENEEEEKDQDTGISRYPNIPQKQVKVLIRQIQLGNQAKDALIEANLRLVVSIAKRYRNRGLAFLDLIQEGNLGLMRAVEKFDYRKGFKFSTYATWWIRQSIIRALADQSRTIRIPVHVVEEMNRVLQTQRQWLQDQGREPTLDELSAKLFMHPERIREILRMNQDTLSLEQPIGDQEMSLSDIIEDRRNEDPDDLATRTMLHDAVIDALNTLPERDRKVMELRFGLTDDGRRHTLEEVARACMVTRERIRQIEIKTLAKLRKPDAAHALREFLDGV